MRRFVIALLLCGAVSTSVGCFLPIYSADQARRGRQLLFTSENLRSVLDEWERIWFLDQPDHMNPYRVHGGIVN